MEKVLKPISPWKLALLSAFILFYVTPGYAIDVPLSLEWAAVPGADYYVVHWGQNQGAYTDNSNNYPGSPITTTTYSITLPDDTYYFVLQAFNAAGASGFSEEIYVIGPNHPDLDPQYDRGWGITSGDLKGFKIMYSSTEGVTPTLGPSNEIPVLNLSGVSPLGSPLNLQPSPTYFNTPVKIFIPCQGYSDLSNIIVYHYDDLDGRWLPADDADNWIVADSFEEHYETDPNTVAIEVNHFSGAQAGTSSSSASSSGGGGGCFIATAAVGTEAN